MIEKKNKIEVPISTEDSENLERLHYMVEARANLLIRLATDSIPSEAVNRATEKYTKEYDEMYPKYLKLKEWMENKYHPEESFNYWEVDFVEHKMIFWS